MWFAIPRALIGLMMVTTSFAFVATQVPTALCEVPTGLTGHDPILIASDDEFTEENGVASGTGTESDPYIIEGWDINASEANGIEIMYTTAHFVIRDVFVHHGRLFPISSGYSPTYEKNGIVITDCENVRLEKVCVSLCVMAVMIEDSRYIVVEEAEVSDSVSGVSIQSSSYVDLVDVTVSGCSYAGVSLSFAHRTTIEGCRVQGCTDGLRITYDTSVVRVADNIFAFNNIGLNVEDCTDSQVVDNIIASNERAGIFLQGSRESEISGNLIEKNGCGAYLVECSGCSVFENDFSENDMQAFDIFGTGDLWYNETSETGNYWSDNPDTSPRMITTDVIDEFPSARETWDGDHLSETVDHAEEDWCMSFDESFWMTPMYASWTSSWSGSSMDLAAGPDGNLHAVYVINRSVCCAVRSDGCWTSYVVDIAGNTNEKPAITVDDDGYVHIAYLSRFYCSDGDRIVVMHVTNMDGAFRIFQIAELHDYRWGTVSTEFDGDLNIHLVYRVDQRAAEQTTPPFVTMEYCLRHATDKGGEWTSEDILPFSLTSYNGFTTCIDTDGALHVVYAATSPSGNGSINYTTNSGGEWSEEMIVSYPSDLSSYSPGPQVLIELDSHGDPHAVFANCTYYYYPTDFDTINGTLVYCSRSESGWSAEIAVTDPRIGRAIDFALDSRDRAHILYYDGYNYDAMYTTNSAGNATDWTEKRLQAVGFSGDSGAILIDASDEVHMIFFSVPAPGSSLGLYPMTVIYATSHDPDTDGGALSFDLRYVVLAAIVAVVLTSSFLVRRWRQ